MLFADNHFSMSMFACLDIHYCVRIHLNEFVCMCVCVCVFAGFIPLDLKPDPGLTPRRASPL